MLDLSVEYLGFKLKNPVIVGSCGFTNDLDNLKKIENYGAGAIILKSLFEEQIMAEISSTTEKYLNENNHSEADDYMAYYIKENNIGEYLNLINIANRELTIPVIPSINCSTDANWLDFALEFEKAGARGIEINIFKLPGDFKQSGADLEKIYYNIAKTLKNNLKIPVALKIAPCFSSMAEVIYNLANTGIDGLVLFNRFMSPDIDLVKKTLTVSNIFSTPDEISNSLRWIGLMADNVKCPIIASTGFHDGYSVIKAMLVGATAVEIASTLYKNGMEQIPLILHQLEQWMTENNYNNIKDFQGMLNSSNSENPEFLARTQFMKYYSNK